jgi:hypothetical protein
MKTSNLRITLIAAVGALCAPLAVAAPAVGAASVSAGHLIGVASGAGTNAQQSLNWSGYIKPGTSGAYSSSIASWTVPTLSTKFNGFSSTWVGIDGATSGDGFLIQTGTEADVINGKPKYDAWSEVITPTNLAPEVVFTGLTIHPGDKITASVFKATGVKWTMNLTDVTTNKTGTKTVTFKGPGESVEWIQEDTEVNSAISAAPDWKKVTFTAITVAGVSPGLLASQEVNIVDTHGTHEDRTSAPNATKNGFSVTWLAPGTPTPI